MVLDVRSIFIIGVAALIFSRYSLEKSLEREEIYWIFALLSFVLAVLAAYTVVVDSPLRATFIPLSAISIALAIIYHFGDGGAEEA